MTKFILETGLSQGGQAYRDFMFTHTLAAMGIVGFTAGDSFIINDVSPMDAAIIQATFELVYGVPCPDDCFVSSQLAPMSPNWENTTEAFLCRN